MAQLSTNRPSAAAALAAEERRTGARLADGPYRWVLIACAAIYLIGLFLPFVGSTSGVQVLIRSSAAQASNVNMTEYLFAWISFAGLAVVTTIAMLARRYGLAALGWALTVISVAFAMFSLWLRNAAAAGGGEPHGVGAYLAMVAVLVAALAYAPAIIRRSDEQQAITVERAAVQGSDELSLLQRDAATKPVNPLLVDDRRARAAERHKRTHEQG